MSGSVLRLTLLVVVSVLPDYSVLQRAETFMQQPFRFRTNFLKEFLKIRNELFPYSSPVHVQQNPTEHPFPYPREDPLGQSAVLEGSESRNSIVVKRRVPQALLENPKIRNIIRQKVKHRLGTKLGNSTRSSRTGEAGTNNLHQDIEETSDLQWIPREATSRVTDSVLTDGTTEATVAQSTIEVATYPLSTSESPSTAPVLGILENTSEETFDISLDELTSSSGSTKETSEEQGAGNIFSYVFGTLTQLPIIGNVFKASVDPLYRPLIDQIRPAEETWGKSDDTTVKKKDVEEWCFGILGCLEYTKEFFHPVYRPVNFPPNSRKYINVHFCVHSREEPKGYEVSAHSIEDVLNSTFKGSRPTKIIIHGFLHDRQETWIWEMVRGFLIQGDNNVITVDWSSGSRALYSQATANSRVVALEIARLLEYLAKEYSMNFKSVHIVGHSLGAHTAGYVGSTLKGTLSRITGLDPAEPYFQYMPAIVRLDPTDANFVDVIHTDIDSFFAITGPRGFGLQQAVGHVDFYPNGGHNQPGCNQLLTRIPYTLTEGEDIVEGIKAAQTELVSCDHIRAPKLFTDSLLSSCPYLAYRCSSYKEYKEGKCFSCGLSGEDCASMGINANRWSPGNRTNVKMFLDTHHSPNFCLYHYLLKINFADPVFSTGTLRGRLEVTIINEEGDLRKFDLTALSPIKFPRRGSKTFILVHNEDLTGSQEALLSWTFESDLMDPFTFCVLFCRADIGISSVSLISVDSQGSQRKALRLRGSPQPRKGGEQEALVSVWQEVIMCHKKGDRVVLIRNKETVKISASPLCSLVNKNAQIYNDKIDSESTKIQRVSLLH